MEVSVEVTEGLGRRLTVKLPPEPIEAAVKARINKIAKTAKVDGFRAGKVPLKVVEKRYGGAARTEVLNDHIQKTLFEAVQQEKLNPAGMPDVNITKAAPNEPVEYIATFEVYPDINLVDLKDVEVAQIESAVTDEDVDKLIDNLRKQSAAWDEVDRVAANDDRVMIDFEGFIDGEPFEGGKAAEVPLVLGSKTMIPGFETGILAANAKAGDEFEIDVTFPEDYFQETLAGKPAKFKIKVHKVLQAQLPELDDAFASKFNVLEGGVEALREKIRENMSRELHRILKIKNKTALFDKLLELNGEILVPKELIDQETDVLKRQMAKQMGVTDESKMPDIPIEKLEPQAIRRVRLGLLIAEVVKAEELKSDEKRVREMIEDVAKDYEYPDQIVSWYYEDPKRLVEYQMVAMEDQVVDRLAEMANISKKSVSYEEALKSQ